MSNLESFNWYFRIEGLPTLRERLMEVNAGEAVTGLLCNPTLWIYTETGLSRLTMDMISAKVKLLFLANLSWLYLSEQDADAEMSSIVWDLLGQPPIGIDVFDRWWNLEQYEMYESVSDIQQTVQSKDLKLLGQSGYLPIDNEITNLIEAKERFEQGRKS